MLTLPMTLLPNCINHGTSSIDDFQRQGKMTIVQSRGNPPTAGEPFQDGAQC